MKKTHVIWLHVIFWLLFSIIPELLAPPAFYFEKFFLITLLINIANFYVFYSFIIPGYLKNKRKIHLIFFGISFTVLFIILRVINSENMTKTDEILLIQSEKSPFLFILKDVINTLLFVVYPFLMTFTVRYFKEQKIRLELIQQKNESEMALLHSQLNPHFFFNTLNSIYSLVYNQSPQANKAILKMSELMRYSLYRSQDEKMPLEEEINYLNTYIELESLRIKQKGFIKKSINGNIHGKEITPMLLTPFVENAFKHCDKHEKVPVITMTIELNGNMLHFSIKNTIEKLEGKSNSYKGGIGLANVKRRLEIQYPEKHKLDIRKTANEFIVHLNIELS